jgi:Cu-processing system permease protein
MQKISNIVFQDLLKNKVVVGYFLLLSLIGWGMFMIESHPQKVILTLLQVTLMILPPMTVVFATIYYYNSQEFILMLLSQPIHRKRLFRGLFFGLALAFALAYLFGLGLPLLIFYPSAESVFLLSSGLFLSFSFTAIALFMSTHLHDKARGMGAALVVWAVFAFVYDGLLLLFMYQFSDYPIEKAVLVLSFFNPIDIARILVIMKTEASAMLGLSGAVFKDFFGSSTGVYISAAVLSAWVLIPFAIARRKFIRKDL